MFCSQCGAKSGEADRFCSNCGKATTAPSVHAQNSSSAVRKPSASLTFGTPNTRWWLSFKGKNSFPPGYEWLEQRNTLLVCRDYLVLVQGDEKRSAALDVAETMGMIGGIVGAIRGMKDSFLNTKHELSADNAERLFADRLMVWCKKSDAVVWRYHEKPWMFIKSSSEQLYCKFNSLDGVLHACAVLWCTAQYSGRAASDVDSLGCQFVDAGHNLLEKDVPKAMDASRMSLPD